MKKLVGLVMAIAFTWLSGPAAAQEVLTDEILANADLDKGQRTFLRCRACHTLAEGERDKIGPNLWGIFGREAGTKEGFKYSQALQTADFVWTADKLNEWLTKPKDFLPGNNMAFVGIPREADRISLIAYLVRETQTVIGDAEEGDETTDAAPDGADDQTTDTSSASTEETEDEAAENASDEGDTAAE